MLRVNVARLLAERATSADAGVADWVRTWGGSAVVGDRRERDVECCTRGVFLRKAKHESLGVEFTGSPVSRDREHCAVRRGEHSTYTWIRMRVRPSTRFDRATHHLVHVRAVD